MQETQVWLVGWEDSLEKIPTPVLPGESYGQRSLMGYCAWGRKESDTIERLTLSLSRWNKVTREGPLGQKFPTLLAPGAGFVEDDFSMDGVGDALELIQAYYICCALYF